MHVTMLRAYGSGGRCRTWTFEVAAIPNRQRRTAVICAAVEIQDHLIRIGRCAHLLVGQDELRELGVEIGGVSLDGGGSAPRWLRVGVRDERRLAKPFVARPEACECLLLLRTYRHPAGRPLSWWRRPPRVAASRGVIEPHPTSIEPEASKCANLLDSSLCLGLLASATAGLD
jgi:hypothetical protein